MSSFVTTTIVIVGLIMAIILAILAYVFCCRRGAPRLSHLPSAVVVTAPGQARAAPYLMPQQQQQQQQMVQGTVLQPVPQHLHRAGGGSEAPMGTVVMHQPVPSRPDQVAQAAPVPLLPSDSL
jgi:hypothetical protein